MLKGAYFIEVGYFNNHLCNNFWDHHKFANKSMSELSQSNKSICVNIERWIPDKKKSQKCLEKINLFKL